MKAILSIYLITVGLLVSLGASSAKAQVSIADGYAIITSSDIRAASQMLDNLRGISNQGIFQAIYLMKMIGMVMV